MPFATRFRLFSYRRALVVLLALASLASSCQSSRASFSFQPAAGRLPAVLHAPISVATRLDSATSIPTYAPKLAFSPRATRSHGRLRRPYTGRLVASTEAVTANAPAVASRAAIALRRPWLRRPHTTAEAGLGTTVLGVLGLVVLPIALIGLLLSGGGLVWGVLAGLAGLAVLVAYIDPFGG
ncbi:hypothetical protein [Hymenobacter rubidus]|uniref:hypothetical protein n=1 Tax=Hymenobacter rubidus TaxID=1441626 RepID=UPI00191E2AAC|nr:hypothetical protein [Hymenobacter rubidus]